MAWWPNASAFWSVNYLAPTLKRAGYNPVYIAFEDELINLSWYVDDMFFNEKARKLFSGISVHGYMGIYADSYLSLTETHNRYPDKFLFLNEIGVGNFFTHYIKKILLQ